MNRYLLKRLAAIIPILIGISFMAFVLINLRTSDPAEIALRVNQVTPTQEMVEAMRITLGLDKPFFVRYIHWLSNSIQGDFGISYVTHQSVGDQIALALPATFKLSGVALAIILCISTLIGVFSAIYEGSWLDRLLRVFVFLSAAMPSFWIGILLIWLFSVKLNWFPTSGMEETSSVVLPAVTLSLVFISTYVRLIRNNMIKNKKENFVLYARVRGLKNSKIIGKVFRNSLQLSVTALGMSIPKLIAGTVIVENIFAWPGIGRLCVSAIFNSDFPMIQAYILIMGSLFVFCNLLVDILNSALDPRLRREG
ncbi:nickel transport system permease protein [Paenibacillus sp. PastF-3]|uniref:nickel/cobalt ABC transporter permease n=1 Tax=Paenibacillus sp. PastF-3 TaxID=2940626 RepID=UPI0024737C97|nr:nickel/cobalt ABC transporter permease [Paenibacillus sp. PastF-3]MDH6371569.1 nickel transport system permease protein [Paenibacillus sp. PastF-3]